MVAASGRGGLMFSDYPLFGGYNKHENATFNCEDLVNLYMRVDPGGKKNKAFFNTPGLKKKLALQSGTEAIRALYVPTFDYNFLYAVAGDTVFRINDAFVSTPLSPILGTDSGYVSIAVNNNNQILFVDGQSGYLYNNNAGTFSKISSTGFPAIPLNVAFLDGYFVIPSAESRTFQISALNDGTQWDALDEAQIQAYGGLNVGVGVVNRRLYFFKTDSTEVWYNAGAADFPFRRDNNLIFNVGCLATASIASDYGYLFWLARDKSGAGSVYMTNGQMPQKISSEAIDDLIASLTDPSDVRVWIYKEEGHVFYKMNWTTDDISISYDLTASEILGHPFWFREEMEPHKDDGQTPYISNTRHLADCHAYFAGEHIVGSYKNSNLYHYSRQYSNNDGEPIRRERTGSHFFNPVYNKRSIKQFRVDFETGIGANDGLYTHPKAYLSISRDGGRTFGNLHSATLGKVGERKARSVWRRLGLSRDFVPRITVYADIAPIVMLGASIEYEELAR
jgi:hypothetical protein